MPRRTRQRSTEVASGEERYQEFAPPPALRPFVRVIWTYAAPDPSPTIQRIAPDGCPELIFDLGAPYAEQGDDGEFRLQPSALFAGQMTRPLVMRPTGLTELVAVRFEPDGARGFLGRSLSEATDRRLDMVERLAGFVAPTGDPKGQVAAIAAWLEAQVRASDWTIDPAIRAEIEGAAAERPAPARSPSGQRALQRRFADRVGGIAAPATFDLSLSPRVRSCRRPGQGRNLARGRAGGRLFRSAADGARLPTLPGLHRH